MHAWTRRSKSSFSQKRRLKPVANLGEVRLEMFSRYTAMGSPYNRFNIGYNSMNPWQKSSSSFRISKNYFQMLQLLILSCPTVRSPTITPNRLQKLFAFPGHPSATKSIQKSSTLSADALSTICMWANPGLSSPFLFV